jgi:hypothetical protein
MVDLLRHYGGEVTADIAATYQQTDLVREMLASGKADPAEVLRHGASGGGPEIVGMASNALTGPPKMRAGSASSRGHSIFGTTSPGSMLATKTSTGPHWGHSGPTKRRKLLRYVVIGGFAEGEAAGFADALLNAGVKVGSRDDLLKSTALGWACRWGRVRVAKLMLEYGADPLEMDAEPWARPRAWAEKRGHAEIIELLRKYDG